MMNIKEVLLQWFINFLIKSPHVLVLKMKLNKMNNQLKNCKNQLLENLKKEKYIHHLKIIFGKLIFQICNYYVNLIKEFVFYVIDIFSKYAWVIPKVLQLLMVFKRFWMNLEENQNKIYVKAMTFTTDP